MFKTCLFHGSTHYSVDLLVAVAGVQGEKMNSASSHKHSQHSCSWQNLRFKCINTQGILKR